MTTYHRTLLLIEVLGDEPYTGGIVDLDHATDQGGFSGTVLMESSTTLDEEQVAQLLILQGSSPGFLIMDDDEDPLRRPLMLAAERAGVHPGRLAEMREDSTLAEIAAETHAVLAAKENET